jgi:hypothetical protein
MRLLMFIAMNVLLVMVIVDIVRKPDTLKIARKDWRNPG